MQALIYESEFENAICKIEVFLFWPMCGKKHTNESCPGNYFYNNDCINSDYNI